MNQFRGMICSLCFVLALSTVSHAQEERNRPLVPERDIIVEPFDRYGDVSWESEKARLDNFAAALQSDPDLIGYIIVYGGTAVLRCRCAA
jgi:hypothetical protein